jgi:hypothetical protein
MNQKPKHTVKQFPSSRQSTFDVGYLGLRKHHIKALIELDVTAARELIKKARSRHPGGLSFTAWIVKCIGRAIEADRTVHAVRQGKNRLVIFDDIDISLVVEKEVAGEKVPLPVVIRKVNQKSPIEIHQEIKAAKEQGVGGAQDYVLGESRYKWAMKLYVSLPQWIRLAIWRVILRNPFLLKDMAGTVIVTSVGMIGRVNGWVIPVSLCRSALLWDRSSRNRELSKTGSLSGNTCR